MRTVGEEVLGKTSGKVKTGKETWWWCEEVQRRIREKKEARKRSFEGQSEENRAKYKTAKREAKRAVAVAKARAYDQLYKDLDTGEGMKKVLKMAKQRDKSSKDIYQAKLIKSEEGNVLVKDKEILERWQTYFMELLNEENTREAREEEQAENPEVVEAIIEVEVKRALKKMQNGKAREIEYRKTVVGIFSAFLGQVVLCMQAWIVVVCLDSAGNSSGVEAFKDPFTTPQRI
ncbi:uncharacterized protein LOC134768404 [Penaeus indicus]|uniref:uncharacterized protein LOC134768404 n=1 Tax=Penaeus indicus TaxID=29960 RepID=UPI00300D4808